MRRTFSALAVLFVLLAGTVVAQWLDYKRPGVPRTPDGKPKLDAPAPKALDGKPDLSGVWMHEKTSVEEMRRLYGPFVEEAIKVDVPGMEIGTQHKYAFNILLDFKPADSPMRSETAAIFTVPAYRPCAGSATPTAATPRPAARSCRSGRRAGPRGPGRSSCESAHSPGRAPALV